MSDNFYRAFEERYYAPRSVIKSLRTQYLGFAKSIATAYPGGEVFDAGCGRGEWLELMQELGFLPFGVDLDDGMLSDCQRLFLPAVKENAIDYIKSLANESQVIVSAFHVVEHISFDDLRIFVSEALRVLKPGGLLIMETPNPENIIVATRNFYLDPTHQRPIPSGLLSFVAEYAGFHRVKTLRLQEPQCLYDKSDIGLMDVLSGVSPDYAVIAQKSAPDDFMKLSDEAFGVNYGLSLDDLIIRWESHFSSIETKAQQAESKARAAQEQAQSAQEQAQSAQEQAQSAQDLAEQFHQQLLSIHLSKSWRFTAPFRKIVQFILKIIR